MILQINHSYHLNLLTRKCKKCTREILKNTSSFPDVANLKMMGCSGNFLCTRKRNYALLFVFTSKLSVLFHCSESAGWLNSLVISISHTVTISEEVHGILMLVRHQPPYLRRVLDREWCFLVLRRAARCPLMGTVLIRSKCTLLLLKWPGRAGPGGGEKGTKRRRRRRENRSEKKGAAKESSEALCGGWQSWHLDEPLI